MALARARGRYNQGRAQRQQLDFANERQIAQEADQRAYRDAALANQQAQTQSLIQQREDARQQGIAQQRMALEMRRRKVDALVAKGVPRVEAEARADDDASFREGLNPAQRNIDPLSEEGLKGYERRVAIDARYRTPDQGPAPVQMTDAEGNVSFVNPRTGQVVAQPPAGFHGGMRTATEGERKGAALLNQARNAYQALQSYSPSLQAQQLSRIPVVGNILAGRSDPEGQAAQQAGFQFADAYLRFVSGAAVPETEVRRYMMTFLPQPGDQPLVIARKKAAQKAILESLEIAAGRVAPKLQDGARPSPRQALGRVTSGS